MTADICNLFSTVDSQCDELETAMQTDRYWKAHMLGEIYGKKIYILVVAAHY